MHHSDSYQNYYCNVLHANYYIWASVSLGECVVMGCVSLRETTGVAMSLKSLFANMPLSQIHNDYTVFINGPLSDGTEWKVFSFGLK